MASLFLPYKLAFKLSSFLKPRRKQQPLIENPEKKDENLSIDEKQKEGNWKQLPELILEKIIQKSNLSDSLQMSAVCKSWRSILKQINIRNTQVPWLMLPLLKDSKYLTFFDLSESRSYNINLPKKVQGSWCCGASKGWLIMARGYRSNPKITLFNPISGVQLPLPSLQTIPFFRGYEYFLRSPYNSTEFIHKIVLSSVNAENCVVAGIFLECHSLALCRPGDKEWTIFEQIDMSENSDLFLDILFTSDGILNVLIFSFKDEFPFRHNLSVGDRNQIKVTLKIILNNRTVRVEVEDEDEIWELVDKYDNITRGKEVQLFSYLVESDGELLIVNRIADVISTDIDYIFDNVVYEDYMIDMIDGEEDDILHMIHGDDIINTIDDDNEDDEDDDNREVFSYVQTSRFEVFKFENPGSDMSTRRLYNLGDRVLFVSSTSDLVSVPARDLNGLKKNCIFFLNESCYSGCNYDPLVCCESGIFYVGDGKIERCFPSTNNSSIHYRMNWF